MAKLTEHAKDRPYSQWADNAIIADVTSCGLRNGDGEFNESNVLKRREQQKGRFNKLVDSWARSRRSTD